MVYNQTDNGWYFSYDKKSVHVYLTKKGRKFIQM